MLAPALNIASSPIPRVNLVIQDEGQELLKRVHLNSAVMRKNAPPFEVLEAIKIETRCTKQISSPALEEALTETNYLVNEVFFQLIAPECLSRFGDPSE